eukprot:PhF_6_TR40439/c0_g1_i3/m.60345
MFTNVFDSICSALGLSSQPDDMMASPPLPETSENNRRNLMFYTIPGYTSRNGRSTYHIDEHQPHLTRPIVQVGGMISGGLIVSSSSSSDQHEVENDKVHEFFSSPCELPLYFEVTLNSQASSSSSKFEFGVSLQDCYWGKAKKRVMNCDLSPRPECSVGDVIGIGVTVSGRVFFTRNGVYIGLPGVGRVTLPPADPSNFKHLLIVLRITRGIHVTFNFGNRVTFRYCIPKNSHSVMKSLPGFLAIRDVGLCILKYLSVESLLSCRCVCK